MFRVPGLDVWVRGLEFHVFSSMCSVAKGAWVVESIL